MITQRLNLDFWSIYSEISHSLYVGSYGRNTAINGVSDIDMVFELPANVFEKYNAYISNGQSALLQAVRSSLLKTYPNSRVGGDGQVVAIDFADGITFEIVPVFTNDDGSYIFPDSNDGGKWRTTNPRAEIQAIRERNSNCNENLYRLCRMMRSWKSQWDVPIGGLLIDTFAHQFIGNWSNRDKSFYYYDFMCRDFFKWVSEQSPDQMLWRAPGSNQYVFAKGPFIKKASKCHDIALEAIEHEMATPKREWSAKQKWREIFGTEFPS